MYINILAGGPVDLLPQLEKYDGKNVKWVGVDRGAITLLNKGINPSVAFGDFDSISKEQYSKIQKEIPKVYTFNEEKDETDLELALNWAVDQSPLKIRIFGGTGGRLDHFLATVQLLIKTLEHSGYGKIEVIDRKNVMFVAKQGIHQLEKWDGLKYVSFFPMTNVQNLTLKGFRYELHQFDLPVGSPLCVSNELNQDYGTFSFDEGILMVIRSRD